MSEWMLWSRFGGSIQLGSAPPPRLYLIPLSTSIEHEGPIAISMGHRNREERTLEGITRALDRAVSGEYDGVIFPSAILSASFRQEVFARCKSRNLKVVHQLTSESLVVDPTSQLRFSLNNKLEEPTLAKIENGDPFSRLDELMRRLDSGDALNLVFGGGSLPKESLVARLTRWPDQVYFTYSVRSADATIEILHRLQPFIRERLFFHFPYHLEFGDGNLSCQQIYELTERIHTRVPGIRVRPLLGSESFDPRVDPDLELEPTHAPCFETAAQSKTASQIEISVIIPSYNNREYLLNTVKHLARQDLSPSSFEVIVVDDGSDDGSKEAVQALAEDFSGQVNFKYIYSPRTKPRKMGDANYRAGISRNLGVKHSRGRILCFLDSDILTPTNYLSDLIEKHRRFDVIQCKRLNLVREKSNADIRFDEVDAKGDTFTTEDGYWEKFYALKDWSKEEFFWKYTCTYGLSVPAKLFKRVGWIRKGFVFYGFEDVELGYRLARVGARFHLNDTVTFHLFHKNERSEFHNSDYLRQALLAKTAQIFYLGRLEPEIYFHFRGLMKEQLPLASAFKFAARKVGILKYFESTRKWIADKPARLNAGSETSSWLMIPFLAVWNWRWFLWRLLQKAKNDKHFGEMFRLMEVGIRALALGPKKIIRNVNLKRVGTNSKWLYDKLQLWRVRKFAVDTIARLQLWRVRKFAVDTIARLQLWRVRKFAVDTIARLQLWRVRKFAVDTIARLQLWRVRKFAVDTIARLQLWRVRKFAVDTVARLQLWRVRKFAVDTIARLQLWRVRKFAVDTIARLQLWRVRKFAVDTVAHLQLWRVRKFAVDTIARLQLWRVRKFAVDTIARLQLWRIVVAIGWILSQHWRLTVPLKRGWDALQLWRLKTLPILLASQLWRLKVLTIRIVGFAKRAVSAVPWWRLQVLLETTANQAWRLKVPIIRFVGTSKLLLTRMELWRFRAMLMRIPAESWRLRVFFLRKWGYFKAMLSAIPFWKIKTIFWKGLYPIRKAYYFARYQLEKRLVRSTKAKRNDRQERL